MKQVTVEMLERLHACRDQVALFRSTFGESADLTAENGEKAAAVGLDIGWLAAQVLKDERLTEYARVEAPAWEEYRRVRAAAFVRFAAEEGVE